jgi:hypothetical protein
VSVEEADDGFGEQGGIVAHDVGLVDEVAGDGAITFALDAVGVGFNENRPGRAARC